MIEEPDDVAVPEDEESAFVPLPDVPKNIPQDERYLLLLTNALAVCEQYKPKFGKGRAGLEVDEFQRLYGADPFYKWMGVDSPLMYAAHKAAGGMTSIYRQLGIGVQWILNEVIQDYMGLTKEDANWTYQVPSSRPGIARSLSLDARIEVNKIQNEQAKRRFEVWMNRALDQLLLPKKSRQTITGAVFEARQGYKSQDSKRQNGDIANASNAYVHSYIPVLLVFSNQLPNVLAERYAGAQWLILRGTLDGSTLNSTYVFCRDVVGYDLAEFFQKHSNQIQTSMEKILKALLNP